MHLGTRSSNAAALLEFLRDHDFETLYIVGDLIDVWQMRRGIYWPQEHNDVIQKLLRKSRKGTRIVYIPGNHDEFLGGFCGVLRPHHDPKHFDSQHWPMGGACSSFTDTNWIPWCKTCVARVRRRRRLPIFAFAQPGDQFRAPPLRSRLLVAQRLREEAGEGRRQFHRRRYEAAIVRYAEKYAVDAVLCGHIHSVSIRKFGDVTYYNCGDWVESCSALVEREDGVIEAVDYRAAASPFRPALQPQELVH